MKHLNIDSNKIYSLIEAQAKVIPRVHSPTFHELHRFKMKIEENKSALHHHPYSVNKGRVLIYKAVFLGISFIFAALAGYLYSIYFNWTLNLFLGTTGSIRAFLCGFTLFLSALSLLAGLWIQPEREITHSIVNKAKRKARKIYSKKAAELTGHHASHLRSENALPLFREHYALWLEEVNEREEKVLLIMKRIRLSQVLSEKEKERLYNQALFELQTELDHHLTALSTPRD